MAFERAAGAPQGARLAPGPRPQVKEPRTSLPVSASLVVVFTGTTGQLGKWACFLLL